MTIYADTPEQLIFGNRTRTGLTPELALEQVNALARMVSTDRANLERLIPLELAVANLPPARMPFNMPRPFDTDFIISQSRDVLVFYTVELMVSATLLGANDTNADVVLNVDQVPTTENKNLLTCVLLLGLSFSAVSQRKVLSGYIGPGQTCNLTTSGPGTKTFIAGQEIFL